MVQAEFVPIVLPDSRTPPIDPWQALEMLKGHNGTLNASAVFSKNRSPELKLFVAEYGRDGLITALQLIDILPTLAPSVITRAAQLQGVRENWQSLEEIGKIFHEHREPQDKRGEEIVKTNGWEFPYYGAVDATPLFIQLVHEYGKRGHKEILDMTYIARDGQKHTIKDAILASYKWIAGRMNVHPKSGYVEFVKAGAGHIDNQMWRDSQEAFHHKDGRLA